jgi:hypothetical protein
MTAKTLLLAGLVCVAGISSAVAQSTVFSVNAVGFVNVTLPPGFTMVSNPLNGTANTISGLIPAPPVGSAVFKFDSTTQSFKRMDYVGIWIVQGGGAELTLNPGEGVFFKNAATTNIVVTFVGTVPSGNLTNSIPSAFSMLSSQVPQAGLLQTDLGFPTVTGDSIFLWNTTTQSYDRFDYAGVWIKSGGGIQEPSVQVGQAFFARKNTPVNWTRNFSISQ